MYVCTCVPRDVVRTVVLERSVCVVFSVGGVTPLAPLTMQEIQKMSPSTVLDHSHLSPVQYHTGEWHG